MTILDIEIYERQLGALFSTHVWIYTLCPLDNTVVHLGPGDEFEDKIKLPVAILLHLIDAVCEWL
jgi:hypothetical protein